MRTRHAVRILTVLLSALGLAVVTATSALASAPAAAQIDPAAVQAKLDALAQRYPNAVPKSVAGWYVDPASRQLVIETTSVPEATTFAARAGAATDGFRIAGVRETPRPFFNLVGGQAIYSSSGGRCSIGFSARNSSGTRFVITAGHCTELGGTWSGYNRVAIGPVSNTNFPTDDFGAIRVTNTSQWTSTSQVQGGPSVLGSTEAAVGTQVCRSGSTTGYRCGTIQAKNQTVNYGGGDIVYGLVRTNACAEPGDSGGSFIAPGSRQAQGMTSGGSGNCSSGGTTFYQPVNEALSRYGLTLVTG